MISVSFIVTSSSVLKTVYNVRKCDYITIVMTTERRTCRPECQRQRKDGCREVVLAVE